MRAISLIICKNQKNYKGSMRKHVAACYLGPSNFGIVLFRFQQNIGARGIMNYLQKSRKITIGP